MKPHLEPIVEELLAVAVHPGVEILLELVARHVDAAGSGWLALLAVVLFPFPLLPVVPLLERGGVLLHLLTPRGRPTNTTM